VNGATDSPSSPPAAIAEVYAGDDAQPAFVRDSLAAGNKVMDLDRFDPALTDGTASIRTPGAKDTTVAETSRAESRF